MEQLFTTVRESCSKQKWSKAIELSRIAEIQLEAYSKNECSLTLLNPRKAVSSSVKLWFEDEDWSCDCDSKEDPCLHVATSTIMLRNDESILTNFKDNNSEPKNKTKISYDFSRADGCLFLKRTIVSGKKNIPITSTLASLATGRIIGPKVIPTRNDYAIESLLETQGETHLPKGKKISTLFVYLSKAPLVRLDGKKILVSTKQTGFQVCIKDEGPGVLVYGKQDSAIKEVYRNGIALCDKVLHPLNMVKLSKPLLKLLAEGKFFGQKEVAYVVSELIPELSLKFPIEILSKKIPEAIHTKPRVEFFLERKGLNLETVAKIVYGDPIIATIENSQLALTGKGIPVRNLEEETNLQIRFHSHFNFHLEENHEFTSKEAIEFVQKLGEWKNNIKKGSKTEEITEFFSVHKGLKNSLSFTQKENNTQLSVQFKLDSITEEGTKTLSANTEDVFRAWKDGESLVPLIEGGWAEIPKAWLDLHAEKLLEILQACKEKGNVPKFISHSVMDFVSQLDEDITIPESLKKISEELNSSSHETPVLPADLQASLRPYQEEGISWLYFLKKNSLGALLADDMGLGKTLQSICLLEKRSLVIAPTSVIYNWEQEISRFRPKLKVNVFHGLSRTLKDIENSVTLTTYSIARLDHHLLSKITWNIIILDEAQNIKNPESKISQAIFNLESHFRLALTGTPIENHLEDVWSLFYFLNRGLLSSRKSFSQRYIKPGETNEENLAHLKNKLKPFVLRRLKSEVAKDLPARTNVILYNELEENEKITYKAIEAATKKELLEQMNLKTSNMMKVLEALLRLRQAACHIGMLPGQEATSSSKVSLLMSCLEKCVEGGHKALIFSQWTKFLDLIGQEMKTRSMKFLRIDGTTQKRGEIVKSFQESQEHPFLLLSLKAAGIGLNLTAADHVFIMDPWWNPAVEQQAADRSYRIGQDKPVIVHKIVTKGSVEENILKLQEKKKNLANAIIGENNKAYKLTREDMISLFQ